MTVSTQLIGKQLNGSSTGPVYEAAWNIVARLPATGAKKALDLGGGAGNFSRVLAREGWNTTLADHDPASIEGIIPVQTDLNLRLPFADNAFDLIVSLEVVEHLESPRHLFRELFRCTRQDGYVIVSTPNQLSLLAKLCLVCRNEFYYFQRVFYPGHITALLKSDFERISAEVGLDLVDVFYTNEGRIPKTSLKWQILPFLKGEMFSDNVLFLFHKPRVLSE
jgi:2-polyprenyl-3-methyl-5-hydroxy-6-metoxy-1,4-benzoquinol methylase